ncbi:protein tyrosine phosphatase [Prevotella sp.]|nr:protein tyrosine phosphatase [Prevotella sp.]
MIKSGELSYTKKECINNKIDMEGMKLTREEALRRWNASKELKRKMSEKLEHLVRERCKDIADNNSISVEIW